MESGTSRLASMHDQYGWPAVGSILAPQGAGARVIQELAFRKISLPLRWADPGTAQQIGVLLEDPESDATQMPFALVCAFERTVPQSTLALAQKLAWNFSRAPLLITIEPNLVRAWSCCEPPLSDPHAPFGRAEIASARIDFASGAIGGQIEHQLHWINLLYGQIFKANPKSFRRQTCADRLMLENLDDLRARLGAQDLPSDTIHDLLGRIIFIQFLFHRKDSSGTPALNSNVLERLYKDGVFKFRHSDLEGILRNRQDAYLFFRWLNERFNGDLFPGKATHVEEREAEWQAEMNVVSQKHLGLLADFISGKMKMKSGQACLWPHYSFDAIPLEFISSIYEAFVRNERDAEEVQDDSSKGVVYTPGYLVDFLLDGVLPWNNTDWDLRVLDGACGSGVFLVKAFQRLVHRWRLANPGVEPKADTLKHILEKNIVGVDIDPHAVRTAAFSLYLAMCDELDPRHYWSQVRFPPLRGQSLTAVDFFDEFADDVPEHKKFDLILGNAPWGKNTITESAAKWAADSQWPVSYGELGPLFLPKAMDVLRTDGRLSMLQPSSLIFGQNNNAREFRNRLFKTFEVDEIVNLSALRFGLFSNALSPSCIVSMCAGYPSGQPFQFCSPKPTRSYEDNFQVVIEPSDCNSVYPDEVIADSTVLSVLRWGGRRDLELIRSLSSQDTVAKLKSRGKVNSRDGIIRGDRRKTQLCILDRPILDGKTPFRGENFTLRSSGLPRNSSPETDSRASTDFSAFSLPQLILKKSKDASGRFQARRIVGDEAALCSHSYITITAKSELLDVACAVYNSSFALYYIFLTSSRVGTYRPEALTAELLSVPLPDVVGKLPAIKRKNVDTTVLDLFGLRDADRVLIEDFSSFTAAEYAGASGPRLPVSDENELVRYAEYVLRVLRAGFGGEAEVGATIFTGESAARYPVRIVALHLGWTESEPIRFERIDSNQLLGEIHTFQHVLAGFSPGKDAQPIRRQRVGRVYTSIVLGGRNLPTVLLIKPNERRYWTRSVALSDGDEISGDIVLWKASAK